MIEKGLLEQNYFKNKSRIHAEVQNNYSTEYQINIP
jgi:hypothetical protein